MIRFSPLFLVFLLFALSATAQTDSRIEKQKKVIADLEKRIASEEREISKLQKGRAATEERVRRLARQIDSRNQLLDETEKQASLLREEIARKDSVAGDLASTLERNRSEYAEMVREAYRNYRHNNYLTFLFSSRDFADVARKITILREVASLRERKMRDIEQLSEQVRTEKEELDRRNRSLDSVLLQLATQREKLERDSRNARRRYARCRRRRSRPCSASWPRSRNSTWQSTNCANSPRATRRERRSRRRPRGCGFRWSAGG